MGIAVPGDFSQIYSALIAERALNEARPKNVASQHINRYKETGPSGALTLSRFNDIGRADTVPAGTEYQTEAAVGSTGVTITPSRRMKMTLVDVSAMRRRVPGRDIRGILNLVQGGIPVGMATEQINEVAGIVADAIMPEAMQLIRSHVETIEYDTVQGFANLSGGVSDTGNNIQVGDVEEALYALENGESLPHGNFVGQFDLRHIYDLKADVRANETATAFTSDLATILQLRPDTARNGLRGALLGLTAYAHDSDVRLTANAGADNVSAIFLAGEGDPEVANGQGIPGCFAFVQEHGPLLTVKWVGRASSAELILMWPWTVGERVDAWGKTLTFDA